MCRFQGRDINTYLSVFVCVSAMGARQSIVSGRKHFGVPILRNPHMVATANHVSLQIYSLHRCIGIWETASSPCSQRWQGTLSIAHAITHLSTRSDEFIFTCQTWSFKGIGTCDPVTQTPGSSEDAVSVVVAHGTMATDFHVFGLNLLDWTSIFEQSFHKDVIAQNYWTIKMDLPITNMPNCVVPSIW